ncbi:MAG: trk system potassium uptake protein TrkA [Dehalococcoidia bacterium]|nr:trk system potassium uptake protein TrkA [Dehalococcoidia bacterium]
MGCSRVGILVATAMGKEGHAVVVLDPSAEGLRRLPQELQEEAMVGDGTLEDDLRRAGIESMDVFVAVSDMDTDNALAAQMAQHVFRVSRVVCRIDDPARCEMYTELGLKAVSSTRLTSDLILEALRS